MSGSTGNVTPLSDYRTLGVRSEDVPWRPGGSGTVGAAGGDGGDDMNERIGKLEGAIEGLRHSQNLVLGAVGIVAALVIGLGAYSLTRLDQLNDKVSEVPERVGADLRDLTKTLAVTITASKLQAPQVILLPAPSQRSPQEGKKPRD